MDQRKNQLITNRITVTGIVQGVGFRPLVYHIAEKYAVKGTVRNLGGSVEIIAQAPKDKLQDFLLELRTTEGGHEIIKLEVEPVTNIASNSEQAISLSSAESELYDSFTILNSGNNDELRIIPPDLPVCSQCAEELYDTGNRRYVNPFISCVACGPRYTIMEELPYDRDTTTMVDYTMCASCMEEYNSPESRRHHAQTISCNDCGPSLIYQEMGMQDMRPPQLTEQKAFQQAVAILQSGGIIAVKGIGGYHFVCSPLLENTVSNLRLLKGREEKPFAVMFAALEQIKSYCYVLEEEEKLLLSKPRPIVLLYSQKEMAPSVNKGSIYCGAFLPYTPLQLMLTKECGPLIMTSANISGLPIIRDNEELLTITSPYLQGMLYNTRRIVRSVDDSVAKIIDHKPLMIRRSRGYVPYPVFLSEKGSKEQMIFAAGGDLKSAFCLYRNGAAFVSQYFGDLEEVAVIREYEKSLQDLKQLLRITPTLAVCDLHPNYYSGRFAKRLGVPVLEVQHHHAHIASVMAEHSLQGPVLGIAFDGTGYGTDSNIWGGEFLVCEGAHYQRVAHLNYMPILGGDQSMKDAKKTATCYLSYIGLEEYIRDDRSQIIQAAINQGLNSIQTSSMGRLFDVVASLLAIGQYNHYEGECASLLEREAVLALRNHIPATELSFAISEEDEIIDIKVGPLLEKLCRLRDHEDRMALALGFHYAVADMMLRVCEIVRKKYQITQVALSGGVFVNSVLMEKALEALRSQGFDIYCNIAVPPGDGGISLGQTYLGQWWFMDGK
jgi:hydrogenase maturation protein HypF